MLGCRVTLILGLLALLLCHVHAENKYSEEANTYYNVDAQKPFRMGKLNLLWNKAKQRLGKGKLKDLMGELQVQDKEELTLKKLKSEGGDKDGMKEAKLRRKLHETMKKYSLVEHFENTTDLGVSPDDATHANVDVHIFKDKKLQRLWHKAAQSEFSESELMKLKEEFLHHEEKQNEYHELIESTGQDANRLDNEIDLDLDGASHDDLIRNKHKDLKEDFQRLQKLAGGGDPGIKEFQDPKVLRLWKLALQASFTPEELESLRVELQHFDNRIVKLHYLEAEVASKDKKLGIGEKPEEVTSRLEENLQKVRRNVDKLHDDLESRIITRHLEL